MRFSFILAEKASFPVAALCRALGVSRQGFYAHLKRQRTPRAAREQELQAQVQRIHAESRGTYGSPRVHGELRRRGIKVGKRRVERAMRSQGLAGRTPRRWRVTTRSNPAHAKAPNTLARDFAAERPNTRWVTDITYVWTAEGWCYLAAVLDLFSRAVVGWSLDTSLATALPLRALRNAVQRRRPPVGLLHHSDQGCQYTSEVYREELARHGIMASMSRRGNCWDNAVAESFFSTLKTELLHRKSWRSREELHAALFDYIEVFYNRRRIHSTLGYKTPAEVEDRYGRVA